MAETVHPEMVLQSPNGELRVHLFLTDGGDLKVALAVKDKNGEWKQEQTGDNPIARWRLDRNTWIRYH